MANKEKFNIILNKEAIKPKVSALLKNNYFAYTFYVLLSYIYIVGIIYAYRHI